MATLNEVIIDPNAIARFYDDYSPIWLLRWRDNDKKNDVDETNSNLPAAQYTSCWQSGRPTSLDKHALQRMIVNRLAFKKLDIPRKLSCRIACYMKFFLMFQCTVTGEEKIECETRYSCLMPVARQYDSQHSRSDDDDNIVAVGQKMMSNKTSTDENFFRPLWVTRNFLFATEWYLKGRKKEATSECWIRAMCVEWRYDFFFYTTLAARCLSTSCKINKSATNIKK